MSRRLIMLFLLVWALLVFRIDAPWYGSQENSRVWIPASVRNYSYYGLETTGLMVTRDAAPVADPANLTFYSHHPPLISWVPTVLTEFIGFHEMGIRYAFAVATLISVVAFYVFVRRLYGETVAFWAAAIYGLVPMTNYFGRVPGHDPLGTMAGLLFAAVFVNWLRRPTRSRLIALFGLVWLAMWTAWPATFIVGCVGIAGLFLGNRQQKIAIIGMGVTSVIAFVVMIGSYQLQWSGSIDSLADRFLWRSSNASGRPDSEPFTALGWISENFVHLIFYYAPTLLILSVMGLRPFRRRGSTFANSMVIALFAAGLIYLLVFRNAAIIHPYYKSFLVPSLAVLAAMAWVYARQTMLHTRFGRPLMDSLLVISVVMSAAVYGAVHYSSVIPEISTVINAIEANAGDDDDVAVLLSNASNADFDLVLEFYTFRIIETGINPDGAAQLAASEDIDIYIYCNDETPDVIPDVLTDYPSESVSDYCTLFRL